MKIIPARPYGPTAATLLPQKIDVEFNFFSPTLGMQYYTIKISHADGPWTAKVNGKEIRLEGDEGERAEFFARDMARVVERWSAQGKK